MCISLSANVNQTNQFVLDYPERFAIPTNRSINEEQIWIWADQQDIATLNSVWYDEHSQCVFITLEWDDQKTDQIEQALTNNFYKYFSNIKP